MSKFVTYIENAYDELLHKVTWPTWSELQQTTVIVLSATILLAVIILGMDGVSEIAFRAIYGIFN